MHTRHFLHLHRVTRSGCNRVCVRLRREWVLEELYIEGLRSGSCAAHGPHLLSADRVRNSLFAVRRPPVFTAAPAESGSSPVY
jgi:hypothetical protein